MDSISNFYRVGTYGYDLSVDMLHGLHDDCLDATMTALTIAAAQSISIAGDVPGNIARHLAFMRVAAGTACSC